MLTTLALSIPAEVYVLAWLVLLTGAGLWLIRVVDRAFDKRFGYEPLLARYCPWHGGWLSERDRILAECGTPVTDSMCDSCEARAYREAGVEVSSDG